MERASEMVERVARAIFDACYGVTHKGSWQKGEPAAGAENFQSADDSLREHFRNQARAAILAMREPTNDMCFEGAGEATERGTPMGNGVAGAVYNAMIDVALGERA